MEWISVNDRLPGLINGRASDVVLVAKRFRSATTNRLTVAMAWLQQMPDGSLIWNDTRLNFPPPEVTHWMPLPEPPEVE